MSATEKWKKMSMGERCKETNKIVRGINKIIIREIRAGKFTIDGKNSKDYYHELIRNEFCKKGFTTE